MCPYDKKFACKLYRKNSSTDVDVLAATITLQYSQILLPAVPASFLTTPCDLPFDRDTTTLSI